MRKFFETFIDAYNYFNGFTLSEDKKTANIDIYMSEYENAFSNKEIKDFLLMACNEVIEFYENGDVNCIELESARAIKKAINLRDYFLNLFSKYNEVVYRGVLNEDEIRQSVIEYAWQYENNWPNSEEHDLYLEILKKTENA